eukprot:CAMPEP_0197075860 /NCGR_PEP_ID=MMETSP1384-20130603/211824_1 /TAXON_ID=29189 /ORGANISM="Ammonia sp." /LENGTH=387 /DNA_ID=CAMNT_0042514709 /DNA_START=26 /DNA_END=1189 /DNA_ORIENTATION=+
MKAVAAAVLPAISLANWGLDNGMGLTPQMGWNSWNHYACNIDQDIVHSTIDSMVSTGLSKYGYIYVNIDDCWAGSRMANGSVVPDTKTFPDGIAPLADYAHSKNLKLGIYSDAGNKTCAGRPGSLGYETQDADSYASWNVDYLKYDNCNNDGIPPQTRYPVMRDALNATGRHIFYSMCEWGQDDPWNWAQPVGNSWRTTGDIQDNWKSMLSNWDRNGPAKAAGPGGWNDPDMLEVGNGGMTTTEYITHFSLWCAGKAPLLIGCDITKMSNDTQMILMNAEAIAVNQDKLGIQVSEVASDSSQQTNVYAGDLLNANNPSLRDIAVVMLNRNSNTQSVQVTWTQLNITDNSAKYVVRDLWKHENVTTTSGSYSASVDSHGVAFLRLYPA